jgi:hypothetical protein
LNEGRERATNQFTAEEDSDVIFAHLALAIPLTLVSNLDVAYGEGLFCDTQEQVEYLIARFDDFEHDREWIEDANAHFGGEEKACGGRKIAYVTGEVVKIVRVGDAQYGIQQILIIGVTGEDGRYQGIKPLRQWAAIRLPGTPI